MARHSFTQELSATQIEIKELEMGSARWHVGRSFLISLAIANVAATTMMLLGH
jgi:hypothetical protein